MVPTSNHAFRYNEHDFNEDNSLFSDTDSLECKTKPWDSHKESTVDQTRFFHLPQTETYPGNLHPAYKAETGKTESESGRLCTKIKIYVVPE